jgi:hypothetical protein
MAAPLLAEHLQHALRDGEAAEHVDRNEREADDPQPEIQAVGRSAPPGAASSGATCTRAAMAMMLLIALVTLMSGVCSAGVTFQITM